MGTSLPGLGLDRTGLNVALCEGKSPLEGISLNWSRVLLRFLIWKLWPPLGVRQVWTEA